MDGLAFLRECLPGRLAPNIRAMVRMAEYSRATLRGMRAELGIEYDHLERGILNFYRDQHEFENSQRAAGLMRDFGVRLYDDDMKRDPQEAIWVTLERVPINIEDRCGPSKLVDQLGRRPRRLTPLVPLRQRFRHRQL